MVNEINLYAVDTIIQLGKMFDAEGWKMGSIFVTGSEDVRHSKKKVDIFGSDLTPRNGSTKVMVSIDNDEKFHRAWFKLVGWDETKFSSWKMYSESIEYRGFID